jgi:hypothetical protein
MKPGFDLSPRRVALALIVGAAFAAFLAAVQWLAAAVRMFGPQVVASFGLETFWLVFVRALASWSLALILIGAPAWWLLHRHGWHGWRSAILAGMGLTFVTVVFLAIPLPGQPPDPPAVVATSQQIVRHWALHPTWQSIVIRAVLTSFVGGGVGGLMWRIAYRRTNSQPQLDK